ncbi:hypothetical protein [Methylobacterium isbiliense]|uniref:Uncharacterized protein n=1 Tax=Methylobacterium isbiliense TaxID=315478 RepID=A0ABQ4SG21_9HYPH|nr:hypothetical protein [Methylobacterium isbiliense]MDN3627383.1 hypothetical protein [Methylobacterium isbiliense]GJE02032.1 hypothetical protein GMJLKIPL_3976 [Methylobacterium isbiliense]
MRFPTTITIATVLRNQKRPGFTEPFHKVLFAIEQDVLDGLVIPIWVHPAWPEDLIEAVARAFLAGRLVDLASAAEAQSTMTPDETDALWQTVKPPTIEGHPT